MMVDWTAASAKAIAFLLPTSKVPFVRGTKEQNLAS